MIEFINSWAKGIIFAIIITTIIEMILPEGNNKKYVKTIIGIYILFVTVYPLISNISNKNLNLDKIIDKTSKQFDSYKTDKTSIDTNAYIEETYKNKIEEDIKEKMSDKGYSVESLEINIEIENEEKYGEIKNIKMYISKTIKKIDDNKKENTNSNDINTINEVRISSNGKTSNKNILINNDEFKHEFIPKEKINSLKEYLGSIYGISTDKISINE